MNRCASVGAIKALLQLPELNFVLNEHWLAMADEISQGRCYIKHLIPCLVQRSRSEASEAVKAIASVIRLDHNLESLWLSMRDCFTDEAVVALAEALTVNKTLRKITLRGVLSAPAYEAFCAMLRVNTSLALELPPFNHARSDGCALSRS